RCSSGHFPDIAYGVENGAIAGATAEVSIQAVADVLLAPEIARLQQRLDREQEPRSAETALHGGVALEGGREALELGELREPLDREHFTPCRLVSQVCARAHRAAVHEHGAAPTHLHVTRALRAREPEAVAEQVEKERVWLRRGAHRPAVEAEVDGHPGIPLSRP